MADETEESDSREIPSGTIYKLAMDAMLACIPIYLGLAKKTKGFTDIKPNHLQTFEERVVVLAGLSSPLDAMATQADEVVKEWQRMQAVPFDTEIAITKGVYIKLRERVPLLLDELEKNTRGFMEFSPEFIGTNPHMLPILQRLANIPSKAELKSRIGGVSDNAISSSVGREAA